MKSIYQNQRLIIQTQRAYHRHCGVRDSPRYESKGSVSDIPQSSILRLNKNEGVFGRGSAGIEENTNTTIWIRSRQVWITSLMDQLVSVQQYGATAHTTRATIQIGGQIFWKRILTHGCGISWPPRSPDLTTPEFFLYGYLKESHWHSNNWTTTFTQASKH